MGKVKVLKKDTSIQKLRELANKVAADHGFQPPEVVAGRGMVGAIGQFYSYQLGDRIELARHHRNKMSLLHEMAHWLAHSDKYDHGPAFKKRYLDLVNRYVDVDFHTSTS